MRWRKVALPKSNSWLPGTKMSGAIRLVRVRMRSPRSRPDISDGDSVSPAWATITLAPWARSALTTADRPTSAAGKIGVLLVNLGTPEAADAPAVRRYLKEFLTDPRVIEDQGALWQLVLNGVILPIRPRRKARDYAKIWNHEKNESPLKTITRSQAEKLARALEPLGPRFAVDWAMRYGSPSIASTLTTLVGQGCERILVIPLYPQYCAATTATVCDE